MNKPCKPGDKSSPCAKRRAGVYEALSQRDAIKAAEHMMKGLAEMVGVKRKEDVRDDD